MAYSINLYLAEVIGSLNKRQLSAKLSRHLVVIRRNSETYTLLATPGFFVSAMYQKALMLYQFCIARLMQCSR